MDTASTIVVQSAGVLNSGDTAWMLISAALVLLMTPGLSLFYAGLVTSRSAINTMNMGFICLAVIPVVWAVIGYSLGFSPGHPIVGNFYYAFLNHVTDAVAAGQTTPGFCNMIFQMMFAIVTPALISGAFVGRIKFKAYVLFIVLWSIFIYAFVARWVWNPNGFLDQMGVLDFAGGTVVHINAGFSALVACLFFAGKNKKDRAKGELPHNVPFVILGGSLLWFGWFGFNAGSAGGANGLAALAFTTTALATASAAFAWMILCWLRGQPVTAVGSAIAVVIGLVAITPGAGYVTPMSSILIGAISALVCYFAILYKSKFLSFIEDPLDVFICHGISGVVGSLLVGFFATKAVNPLGENGLFYGNPELLLKQAIGVGVTIVFCSIGTLVILFFIKSVMSIEPTKLDTERGIDVLEHGESAYEELDAMVDELSRSKGSLERSNNQLKIEIVERKRAEEDAIRLAGELKISTRDLESRNAELDQFAYIASHDLKAPLRSIAQLSQWIEEDYSKNLPPESIKLFDQMKNRVQRMNDLIQGILEYSRVGRVHDKTQDVDTGEMLKEIVDTLGIPTGFSVEIAENMPKMKAAPVPLSQVFANLISNGVKYHHTKKGKITVSFQEFPKYYEFLVSDDGPGIAKEYHEKIFGLFQTLQAKDKFESTGIGLTIVKKIIEKQNGKIWLDSEVGKGTTFHFTWYKI